MTVLHVISGLGIGGAETMLVQVATGLRSRGIPQHVVSLTGRGESGSRLEAAGIVPSYFDFRARLQAPRLLFNLIALVGTLRPTVIQGWMYHGDVMATLAHHLAPGRAQRRLFWNLRAADMDQERYSRIIRWAARLSRRPDIVIANSEAGARAHAEFGYRPRRFEIIPNGIDTEKFRPDSESRSRMRAELNIPDDAVVAIHVARVDVMKDHPTFLAAMTNVPDVTGVLVGLGTEKLTLPPNVRALGVRQDIARLYTAADLVVSSSAFGEGFSNILAEGMSSGLIPIATDVGNARVIVGDAGRIVARRDSIGLSSAIATEARASCEARAIRGAAARQRILMQYTIERSIDAYARIYAER